MEKIHDSHRGRSANFSAAMSRSAERRQCPKCQRKSALTRHSDDFCFGVYCRWDDCNFERLYQRDEYQRDETP